MRKRNKYTFNYHVWLGTTNPVLSKKLLKINFVYFRQYISFRSFWYMKKKNEIVPYTAQREIDTVTSRETSRASV